MRRARIYSLLTTGTPLVALLVISIAIMARAGREAIARVPQVVVSAVRERLDADVRIGGVRTEATGVRLTNVVLRQHGQTWDEPTATIPEIHVACNPLDVLMRRKDIAECVSRIDVVKPRIVVHRAYDGSWSLTHLLKPRPPKKPSRFAAPIMISDAQVIVVDEKGRRGRAEVNRLSGVDAVIRTAGLPKVEFTASGTGRAGRLGRFALSGDYTTTTHSYTAQLDAVLHDTAYFCGYPFHSGVTAAGGSARARVLLAKTKRGAPLRYSARIDLHDAHVRVPLFSQPAAGVSGTVRVSKDMVGVQASGMLGSSPVSVTGCVVDFAHPRLSLKVHSDRVSIRNALSMTAYSHSLASVRIPGTGSADMLIYGTTKDPVVDFAVSTPRFGLSSFDATDVRVSGSYAGRMATLNSVRAQTNGGVIEGSGSVDFHGKGALVLDGIARGISLSQTPQLRGRKVVGRATSRVSLSWTPGDLRISCDGRLGRCSVQSVSVEGGQVRGEYRGGTIHVDELSGETCGGEFSISGDVSSRGVMDLRVAGEGIDLAAAARARENSKVSGTAQFSGSVSGQLDSPEFTGKVEVYHASISQISVERASADLTASRRKVDLERLAIYDGDGIITASGMITNPLSAAPTVNARVFAEDIDADRVAEVSGQKLRPGGTVCADLTVRGLLRNPTAEGAIGLSGSVYSGVRLDSAEASISYWNRALRVSSLKARSGVASLTAGGRLSRDRKIVGEFSLEGFPLSRLSGSGKRAMDVRGALSVSGRASGSLDKPLVSAEFDVKSVALNGERLSGLHGKAAWDDGAVSASDLTLSDGKSSLTIPKLEYLPKERIVRGQAHMVDWDSGRLLALFEKLPCAAEGSSCSSALAKLPRPLGGVVTADIAGSVLLAEGGPTPDLSVDLSVRGLRCGKTRINSVKLAGLWSGRTGKLKSLEAIDGDLNVSAEGSIGPSDQVSLSLDAHNLDIDLIRQWAKVPDNFSGRADVTIVANGSASAPVSETYVEVVDPVLNGIKFDRLRARLSSGSSTDAQQGTGRLDIDEVSVALGSHDFKASGYIPVDWKRLTVAENEPIHLQSSLDKGSLELLSAATGISAETADGGEFAGQIRLTGSVTAPKLDGELRWRKGVLRVPRLTTALNSIDADVVLAGSRISLAKCSGSSTGGGSFTADGEVSLVGMKPSLDLGVHANALRLSGHNLTNIYGEDINAVLTGDLQVTGEVKSPLVAGVITVPAADVSLPSGVVKPGEAFAISIDPRFDGRVILGKDVRFKTARFRAPMVGSLQIGGSLSKPAVDGAVDISDGSISFPMRAFKMLPGSTVQVHMSPFESTRVRVDVQAQARVTVASSTGQSKRYTVLMTARGPMDNLDTSFASSPPGLSEDVIVGLVTGQQQLQQILTNSDKSVAAELSGLVSSAMAPAVFAPIERAFERALGFEEFALDMSYNEPLRVTVGESLWSRFHVSYSAVLGSRTDYEDNTDEFRLAYRFKQGLETGIVIDQNGDKQWVIEGKARF